MSSIISKLDETLKAAEASEKSTFEQEAFFSYKEMADYLDQNFSPVDASPQTSSVPMPGNRFIGKEAFLQTDYSMFKRP